MPSSHCFGFVQTVDEKPKRRLFEVLKSQDLQLSLHPDAEHLLDWFHLARQEAA